MTKFSLQGTLNETLVTSRLTSGPPWRVRRKFFTKPENEIYVGKKLHRYSVATPISYRSRDLISIHLLNYWVTPRLKSCGSDQLQWFVKFDLSPHALKSGNRKILLYHKIEGYFPRRLSPCECKLGSSTRYAGWRKTHVAIVVVFWSLAIIPARPSFHLCLPIFSFP